MVNRNLIHLVFSRFREMRSAIQPDRNKSVERAIEFENSQVGGIDFFFAVFID